ncbi:MULTISPECIES: DJ-1/PfpI family protein [Clostridium]|uniref:DJ-1/PfpI family protein n=1 Tax=Clostridium TaxID=1485 RepID=UPI00069EB207|nr:MULTISPECIES: DJ-1/PfpI family protein [Clostridium]KOF57795.1 thiamine biosynthesis protein ThiJ [Clostridium sp. DMHC 10]MCD2349061.1 DJ-1/PfpI family protein [Clostridium guangxiense]
MGKVLCFIYEGMTDFEMTFACHLLKLFGEKELFTIAYDKESVSGTSGIKYLPDFTVNEVLNFNDVEALIIPGGWSSGDRKEIFTLIKKLHSEEKLLCAICAGPIYLAKAGILKGYSYTTTLERENLKNLGEMYDPFPRETYVDKGVIRDRNIITAKGNSFVDFGVEIFDAMNLFADDGEKIQCAKHYKGND